MADLKPKNYPDRCPKAKAEGRQSKKPLCWLTPLDFSKGVVIQNSLKNGTQGNTAQNKAACAKTLNTA